jgi:CheY-like chemotaxis protein
MARVKILVVDDERGFTRLLQVNLEATGEFEVRVENHSEDACKTAQEYQPDIILLDLVMPRMPGGNVRAQLEADAGLRGIPIVLLTGAVRPQTGLGQWDDGLPEWSDGLPYIIKPATDEQIAVVIRRHARKMGDADFPRSGEPG